MTLGQGGCPAPNWLFSDNGLSLYVGEAETMYVKKLDDEEVE